MIYIKHKGSVVKAVDDAQLEMLLRDAHEAHKKVRNIRTLLKKAAEVLKEKVREFGFGIGTWNFEISSGRTVKVINSQEVKIADPEGLKQLLGDKFDEFVETQTKYRPREKLIKAIKDADSELGKMLREKLEITIKREVRWS